MTDTNYLYEYFVHKSMDDKTKAIVKEKRGEEKQNEIKTKHMEDKKHV